MHGMYVSMDAMDGSVHLPFIALCTLSSFKDMMLDGRCLESAAGIRVCLVICTS